MADFIRSHPLHGPLFYQMESRRPHLEDVPANIFLGIAANLSISDFQSLIYTNQAIAKFFLKVLNDPGNYRERNYIFFHVAKNSLCDPRFSDYFPQYHQNCLWNIVGKAKGGKHTESEMLNFILYLNRLTKLETDIKEVLMHAMGVPGKFTELRGANRVKYKNVMYHHLVSFAQTHIFGTVFGSGRSNEVIRISVVDLPRPRISDEITQEDFVDAEKTLCSSISSLIWPDHSLSWYWKEGNRTEWDYYTTMIVKNDFVKCCHPELLVSLINLRRPSKRDAREQGISSSEVREIKTKWADVIDDTRYWLRQVIKFCQGNHIWEGNPESRELIEVWAALRDHRGSDVDEEELGGKPQVVYTYPKSHMSIHSGGGREL
ncbi:hypothetical protein ABW19_dt0201889 [Dactylella cylindrospora]|nr:hypothetical protein ABW19_dt0201889 [Dactylella cylindrospora]